MDVVQIPMPAQMRTDCQDGHVAEWLRNGLQNRVPRFNSGRGLHINQRVWAERSGAKASAANKDDRPAYRR